MADWVPVDFQVPEAQRLADLTGVASDLDMAREICRTYVNYDEQGVLSDLWLKMSLSMAAVVMYLRTSTSGVRAGIGSDHVRALPEPLREFHLHVKDLRDKWVAHSVNSLEETNVVVYPAPRELGVRRIDQVSTQHRFTCTLSIREASQLIDLCLALKAIVDGDIEAEKTRLLEFARSLPIDTFYEEPDRYKLKRDARGAGVPRQRYGA